VRGRCLAEYCGPVVCVCVRCAGLGATGQWLPDQHNLVLLEKGSELLLNRGIQRKKRMRRYTAFLLFRASAPLG
jgi:hypothetical protein